MLNKDASITTTMYLELISLLGLNVWKLRLVIVALFLLVESLSFKLVFIMIYTTAVMGGFFMA